MPDTVVLLLLASKNRKASRVNRRQRAGSAKRAILTTVLHNVGVPSIIDFSQCFTVYALSHIARSNKTTVDVVAWVAVLPVFSKKKEKKLQQCAYVHVNQTLFSFDFTD